MRILPITALLLTLAAPSIAQVTTNDQALEALPAPASPPSAKKPPAVRPHRTTNSHATTAGKPLAKVAPQVPLTPPANPVIAPPPLVLPVHAPPPPPTVPMKLDAPGVASPIPHGTRITFGPAGSDLNPSTLAAIRAIADSAAANPALIISVTAWAPGAKDDPSTPRRLSLDRALAARAVLINAGIVSERIHAIAKGMTDIGTGIPPDRVDVVTIAPPPAKP